LIVIVLVVVLVLGRHELRFEDEDDRRKEKFMEAVAGKAG